ncbi:MAG: heparinase II/III domain-containing protein, partial [Alphaproteobacteria bacterium]
FNHLMKNLVALSVFSGELAPGIRRTVAQCVLADGGHSERSPMYHLLALLDMRILRACGLEPETVEKMEAALRVMTHPDGEIALFNDSWFGEAPPQSQIIPPDETTETATLVETGYTRLGHGGDAVIFDHGPWGPDDNPAHAHGDFLSVEISVAGRRLIVDPGVATYTTGDQRHATRSAASHNGPHVAGEDTLELWGSFRVGKRARAGALSDSALAGFAPLFRGGWQDGYQNRGIMVRRFVGLWPGDGALLCDLWLGGAGAPGLSSFLVPATWRIAGENHPTFELDGVSVRLEAPAGKIERPEPAQYWPRFESPEPAHKITLIPDPAGPDLRAALWLSWDGSTKAPDDDTMARLFDALAQAHTKDRLKDRQ